MKFKVIKKATIKAPDGFVTVLKGDLVDLPEGYKIHPALEMVTEIVTEKKRDKPKAKAKAKTEPVDLDINKDGKVDEKDNKLMAQHLGAKGGSKSKGKRNAN